MNGEINRRNISTKLGEISDSLQRIELIDAALRPPEPQLLDTCVLQNLDWIDRKLEENTRVVWDKEAISALSDRFGSKTANDLIDLGVLYKEFEGRGGYPWLVCDHNFFEVSRATGIRAVRLVSITEFFKNHQDDWSFDTYPSVTVGMLHGSSLKYVSPLLLKALGIKRPEHIFEDDGPLSFLPDRGDRQIAGFAIFANIPVVLTTDRSTFWKHRERLSEYGVQVMRPTELLQQYESYWAILAEE